MFGLTGETLASQGQVAIDADVHERLTHMATQARAEPGQFLEHLILRAEAIYNSSRLLRAPGGNYGARNRCPRSPPSSRISAA